jgi:hypothetical protein
VAGFAGGSCWRGLPGNSAAALRSLAGFAGIPVRWPAALASTFGGRLRRRFVLAWLAGEQRGGPP